MARGANASWQATVATVEIRASPRQGELIVFPDKCSGTASNLLVLEAAQIDVLVFFPLLRYRDDTSLYVSSPYDTSLYVSSPYDTSLYVSSPYDTSLYVSSPYDTSQYVIFLRFTSLALAMASHKQ